MKTGKTILLVPQLPENVFFLLNFFIVLGLKRLKYSHQKQSDLFIFTL